MAKRPQTPLVVDPDSIPETLCDGIFNVSIVGSFATLTFTHVRAEPSALLKDGTIDPHYVVRARIVLSINNLLALRDVLDRVIQKPDVPAPPSGGVKH
jgi:hypothetical protein